MTSAPPPPNDDLEKPSDIVDDVTAFSSSRVDAAAVTATTVTQSKSKITKSYSDTTRVKTRCVTTTSRQGRDKLVTQSSSTTTTRTRRAKLRIEPLEPEEEVHLDRENFDTKAMLADFVDSLEDDDVIEVEMTSDDDPSLSEKPDGRNGKEHTENGAKKHPTPTLPASRFLEKRPQDITIVVPDDDDKTSSCVTSSNPNSDDVTGSRPEVKNDSPNSSDVNASTEFNTDRSDIIKTEASPDDVMVASNASVADEMLRTECGNLNSCATTPANVASGWQRPKLQEGCADQKRLPLSGGRSYKELYFDNVLR